MVRDGTRESIALAEKLASEYYIASLILTDSLALITLIVHMDESNPLLT